MQKLYIFAAIAAVVLAFTAPYWIPSQWTNRKIRKHSTEKSPFPFSSGSGGGGQMPSVGKPSSKEAHNFPFTPGSADIKVFNKEELSKFDGNGDNAQNPLYLVVLGEVFDVSTGERFYAAGSGYNCFVGKDNSAAFHTGKFDQVQEDVRELSPTAVADIVGWRTFFRTHETYKFVGVLQGLYFDADGLPTDALLQVARMTTTAEDGKAEDERRSKLHPRCNMHYDGIIKRTLVWCDGYKEEVDLKNKMPKDKELRVLRMVHFTSVATGEPSKDCRCLRLANGEADIGSSPFPTAKVDFYFKEKGCDPNLPRCYMKVE